ncbi:MAG: hypothetical protein DMF04_00530 [Verrucomicrobia bacterium]|nr:MAG: hypothetical protein DMF04_00530 [Verrucomicrobiota bacterium]
MAPCLTNQMRSTAVSESLSTAERTSRTCEVDLPRFLEVATGSLFEVVSESRIPRRQQFLDGEFDVATIYSLAGERGHILREPRRTLLGN